MSTVEETTTDMIASYHELNGDIDELYEASISPLGFMRYVSRNRPFVLRGGCSEWPAVRKWTTSYLRRVVGDAPVKVAVTPHGNADSGVKHPEDGLTYFVKPFDQLEHFNGFLDYLGHQNMYQSDGLVKYSQARKAITVLSSVDYTEFGSSENDNLRGEYSPLYQDVEKDIRWASIALGQKEPDAINLWIGNGKSTTALHRDNYENVYCQIIGSKDFVLLSPVETACVNERFIPSATYSSSMEIIPDIPPAQAPCALWDPDTPTENTTKFSHLSRPLHVKLNPGDLFYLPATWYHKVSQDSSQDTICCSVNYWYDMDFEGGFSTTNAFVRNMAWAATSAERP